MVDQLPVVVPDGIRGRWRVETFTVSEEESRSTSIRAAFKGDDYFIPPGVYKRLMRGDVVVMSNTPMEVRTNREFIKRAHGNVLNNGLGIGMVLAEILKKSTVLSVTVIEASAEVIELVSPSFQSDPRVRIIHANAFDWQPEADAWFDIVWHDIWDFICAQNIPEMQKLQRKYICRAGWQSSWCRTECEKQQRQHLGMYCHP